MKDKHELNEETSLWNAFREEGRKRTIKKQNDAKELCELLCENNLFNLTKNHGSLVHSFLFSCC